MSPVQQWVWAQTWQIKWCWRSQSQMYEIELNLNLDKTPCLHDNPFQNIYLSDVNETGFMCLTSPSIYSDHWKSFMTFGIKKSHEMISYILVGIVLLSAWIALLSEWKYRSLTKPCNHAQITLLELYNKSHERSMLSKCPENTPMDHKG